MRAIDFFCGAGGVTCGFIQAEINVLGGIDNDLSCKATYENNNNTKFLHADIRELKKSYLRNEFGITKNDDELIFIGCSPCQYYTNLKTEKSKSKEGRMLLEDFQDFIEYYKPGYIFIENVPGFENNGKSPLTKFKQYLVDNFYHITENVINAKYYGVPQNRRRYILIASRFSDSIDLPVEDKCNIMTIREVIGNLEEFQAVENGNFDSSDFQHTVARLSDLNLERIKRTPLNGGDRRAWKDDPELQVNCYVNHAGHYDVYGRMYWDKPSPTITTKFIYTSNGRYGHPEQNRAISIREGAVLQSFPKDYIFHSEKPSEIAKMIGNAVPPKLAKKIGETIKENYYGAI